MSIAVDVCSERDLADIDSLWREAFPDDEARHRAEIVVPAKLAFQPNLFLIARAQARVVGSIMAGYDGHRGYINRVAVLRPIAGKAWVFF
jgi:predicted N-acetyltransferase YhbS